MIPGIPYEIDEHGVDVPCRDHDDDQNRMTPV